MGHLRGVATLHFVACTLSILCVLSGPARADLTNYDPNAPKQAMSKKLLGLSKSLQMKEAKYFDSYTNTGEVNANDGNTKLGNLTYHSYIWHYCKEWIGGRNCKEWVDPYIALHGEGSDRSPAEGTIWDEYKKMKDIRSDTQYAIWDVKAKGKGGFLDEDNKIDLKRVKDMRLTQKVKEKLERVAIQTADQQIEQAAAVEGAAAPAGNANTPAPKSVLPNMESLREMAGRWTRMFRNRLVANVGEIWAAKPGIEFALGEDTPDCESYKQALKTRGDKSGMEERLDNQNVLDPLTVTRALDERYALCKKIRNMSVRTPAPSVQGNEIQTGGKEEQRIDEWRSQVNIAVVDQVGIDPNAVPLVPPGEKIEDQDILTENTDYGDGGKDVRVYTESNAETIAKYNNSLESAAQKYSQVAVRAGNGVADRADDIRKWKIEPGEITMVKLNGLTPDMRDELNGSGFPRAADSLGGDNDPEENLELQPAKLVVK